MTDQQLHELALDLQEIKGATLGIQERMGLLSNHVMAQNGRIDALEAEHIRRQAIREEQEKHQEEQRAHRIEVAARSKWAIATGLAVGGVIIGAIEAMVRVLAP